MPTETPTRLDQFEAEVKIARQIIKLLDKLADDPSRARVLDYVADSCGAGKKAKTGAGE